MHLSIPTIKICTARDQTLLITNLHHLFTGARYTLPYSQPFNTTRFHGWSKNALYTHEHSPYRWAVLTGAQHTIPVFTARERGAYLGAAFTALDHG